MPVHGKRASLYLICSLDLWERFSFHGMRALLVLFLVSSISSGGFGWSQPDALRVFGIYLSLVYLAPLVVAPLVDRFLGYYHSLIAGAVIILSGHVALSLVHVLPFLFPGAELFKALEEGAHPIANWGGSAAAVELTAAETMLHRAISISFYGSLGLIIVGTGFFKSSIGSLISELYKDESDSERDAAFTIEYFVINIGAFAAPITAGVIGEVYGWHYGFLVAAIGMAVGLTIFLIAARTRIPKELKGRGVRERKASVPLGNGNAALRQSLALGVMLVLILSAYWTMFEQWGGLINLFTDEKIDRQFFGSEIPTSSLQAVNPMFIILLAPLLVKLGTWLDHSKTITVEVSPFHKLAIANILLAVTFVLLFAASAFATNSDTGRAALGWLIAAYFFMALSELLIAPVALSLFTRIAPAAMVSIAVGVFYATASIGAFLSGFVGALAENYGDGTVFAAIAVVGAILSATTLVVGRYYSVGDAQREQS